MLIRLFILSLPVLLLCLSGRPAFAQNGVDSQSTAPRNNGSSTTVYISDVLFVPLRSGQGSQFRILNAGLKSGTRLIRTEVSEDGAWSKVTTPGGTEGWIRNQYVVEKETAQLKLNKALARLALLEKQSRAIKSENSTLLERNKTLENQAISAQRSESTMTKELQDIKKLSAGAIALDKRYQALLEKHELSQTNLESVTAENESLKTDQKMSFLFYGAGLLMLGMLLAIVLPVLKPKKSYSEWT